MIFEKEMLPLNILDVLKLDKKSVNSFNSGRNFDALSFRISSDAVLRTEKAEYKTGDYSICYVPAGLDYRRIASYDCLIAVHFQTAGYVCREIEHLVPSDKEHFKALFERIYERWSSREAGYKYECTAILYEIFSLCYRENEKPRAKDSRIRKSVDYIHKNYKKKDLTIAEIASLSFMSEVYFRRLFKEEFGVSPKKYIVNLRIQNVISLVSSGYYTIKEAALMSGYDDCKYFSSEFKKIKGVCPSDYLYNSERNKG